MHARIFGFKLGCEAASEHECLSGEKAAFRVMTQVMGNAIRRTLVVTAVKTVGGDGNILGATARCPARLGETAADPAPEHISLAVDHAEHV